MFFNWPFTNTHFTTPLDSVSDNKSHRLIYAKRRRNHIQSIIAESGDVAETTGEKIATIIRHQQNVSVNFIETISESTLLKQEKRRSRQSLLPEFANEGEPI